MKTDLIPEKFLKQEKQKRNHKVTSLNIEHYQDETIKELGIDFSKLCRDLLDKYLSVHAPDTYFKNKKKYK